MRFHHPEPPGGGLRIYPVFIPFAGCRVRCVFCSQEAQTGREAAASGGLAGRVERELAALPEGVWELAFYGGTFTALPREEQIGLLDLAGALRKAGRTGRLRCSTRPDAVDLPWLRELKSRGLDCVELGVQSFCDFALKACRRGYSGDDAARACELVRQAGLELGVQLMPGLPGLAPEDFAVDIGRSIGVRPALLRLYPCLVLEGTELAGMYGAGEYVPWSLATVLDVLPSALLRLWENGIRVIRTGLHPEPGLQGKILAGPEHPALGQMLRSRALYLLIQDQVRRLEAGRSSLAGLRLDAPRRFQGEFFGHGGELEGAYASLGLKRSGIGWHDSDYFELRHGG